MLLSFSIFLAWSIFGSFGSGRPGPPDGYLFALFRPMKVPLELCLSIIELGPFYLLAPKFVMLEYPRGFSSPPAKFDAESMDEG